MRSAYLMGVAVLLAAAAACSDAGSATASAQTPTTPSMQRTDDAHGGHGGDVLWGPAPAIFPAGAQMAVMQGDPGAAGALFTVRLRFPNGYTIPAHWHPTDENVTVISGTFLVGMGDKFDQHSLAPLRAGGFITAPAHMNHFAMARGQTEVQVHAIGPFAMTYVNPADDPSTK